MGEVAPFSLRAVVVCGVLWGVVSSLAVSLTQAAGDIGPLSWLFFVGRLLVPHVFCGLVWAAGTKIAETSPRPFLLVALTMVCAWTTLVGTTVVVSGQMAPGNFGQLWRIPVGDLAIYNVWTCSFYGGLYCLGFFATRRATRLRRRLGAYRVACGEAEAQLRESRLRAVRGQLQPGMLLEALSALAQSSAEGRDDGDRLFDLLIAFLRAAMPGLRTGSSTLSRELTILEQYEALRRALKKGPPEWRLSVEPPPEDLGFASLRLLPALDRLSRSAPPNATIEVVAKQEAAGFMIRINAFASPPLQDPQMQRLRSEMCRDLGLANRGWADLAACEVSVIRIATKDQDPSGEREFHPLLESVATEAP